MIPGQSVIYKKSCLKVKPKALLPISARNTDMSLQAVLHRKPPHTVTWSDPIAHYKTIPARGESPFQPNIKAEPLDIEEDKLSFEMETTNSGNIPTGNLDDNIKGEELDNTIEEDELDNLSPLHQHDDITLIDLSMDPEHLDVEELYDGLDPEEAILRANLIPYSTWHQEDSIQDNLAQPHPQQPTLIESPHSSRESTSFKHEKVAYPQVTDASPPPLPNHAIEDTLNYWHQPQLPTNEQQHSPELSFTPSTNSTAIQPFCDPNALSEHTQTSTHHHAVTPFHHHEAHSTAAVTGTAAVVVDAKDVDVNMEAAAAEPPESDSEAEAEEDQLLEDGQMVSDEEEQSRNRDRGRFHHYQASGAPHSGVKEATQVQAAQEEAPGEVEEGELDSEKGGQCGVLGAALKTQVTSYLALPYSERFRVSATTRRAPVVPGGSTSTRRAQPGQRGSGSARGSVPRPGWDDAVKRATYVGKRTAKTKKDSSVRRRAAAARAITAVTAGAAGPARASRLYRERRPAVSTSMSAVRRRLLRPKVMMTPPIARSFPSVRPSLHGFSNTTNSTTNNTCPSSSNAQAHHVPPSFMTVLTWRTELEGLACAASTGTFKNPSQYHRQLCEVLDQIEVHESDLDVDTLTKTKLFQVLKQFRHVNGGKGPGVESLKGKVRGICKRWRMRLREEAL
jgi:hypothetical protein